MNTIPHVLLLHLLAAAMRIVRHARLERTPLTEVRTWLRCASGMRAGFCRVVSFTIRPGRITVTWPAAR